MKKEIGTFERTTRGDFKNELYLLMRALAVLLVINLLYMAVALIRYYNGLEVPKEITLYVEDLIMNVLMLMIFFGIGGIILIAIMPPDFKYCIILDGCYIIFSYPDKELDIINESFQVSKKTLCHLVLKDEEVEIKIPYNREVWKVLKKIRK